MERKIGTSQEIGGVEVSFVELTESLHSTIMSAKPGASSSVKVRLQIVDRDWNLHTGDEAEIEDKRGLWGRATLPLDRIDEGHEPAADIAEELIQAALKHEAEVAERTPNAESLS